MEPRRADGDELVILVLRTAKAMVDRLRAQRPGASSSPMTVVHGLAVHYLLDRDDVTAGELARHLGITKQSTSEVVAQLEQAGVVRRAPHPRDRRARVLLLTGEGLARLDERRQTWREVEDEWATFTDREQLRVVRDALESYLANCRPDGPARCAPYRPARAGTMTTAHGA
ncbi:MAG: MarR family transcriptional regulator [Acidimicrobiia bacterium]